MTNKILITGHEGYLGSVMTLAFLNAGFDVTGLDTGYFRNCLIVPQLAEVPSLDQDIRDLKTKDLEGFDTVIHLAALSNDPIGNMNTKWTEDINFHASVNLARKARHGLWIVAQDALRHCIKRTDGQCHDHGQGGAPQ